MKGGTQKMMLEGLCAVIAGGTSGIGLATANRMLCEGASVVIIGNNPNESATGLEKLRALSQGECVHAITADLTHPDECLRTMHDANKILGKINILVNSAGAYMEKSLVETSESEYEHVLNTNVKATFFMCKAAIPFLERHQPASIVNVSSDAGINGNYLCTAYCASKGAVTVFTKALALELAHAKIRVNCVCPGDVNTPMLDKELEKVANPKKYMDDLVSHYPLGRIAEACEIANVIAFLASQQADFVTGAAWSVDGGLTAS